jgi:inorganic phosphate transporter, PiT family
MLFIAGLLAFYLAWNLGANDVANSMATSVGSKAITLGQALTIAAILEFSGAMLFGQGVSQKLATGILDLQQYAAMPEQFVLGMLSVLLSAGLWMNLATAFGLPVSSSHAVVGAIAGFGWMSLGTGAVQWESLGMISLTWVLTPVMSGTIAALFYFVVLKITLEDESVFAKLQILSACGVAFAHGSNDVGNAIAPFAAIVDVIQTGKIPVEGIPIPLWILAIGGWGIVGGLALWGKKVIETVGESLIALEPKSGFCAELATAIAVLMASTFGLPVSTSHALVGAVIGIGVIQGAGKVQWGNLRSIVLTWFGTIPVAVVLSAGIYWSFGKIITKL